jgi:hypothetical protein
LALLDPILVQAGLIPDNGFSLGGSLNGPYEDLGGWYNDQGTDEDYWPPGKPASFVVRWKNAAISRERLGTPLQSIEGKRRELGCTRRASRSIPQISKRSSPSSAATLLGAWSLRTRYAGFVLLLE